MALPGGQLGRFNRRGLLRASPRRCSRRNGDSAIHQVRLVQNALHIGFSSNRLPGVRCARARNARCQPTLSVSREPIKETSSLDLRVSQTLKVNQPVCWKRYWAGQPSAARGRLAKRR